MKRCGQLNIMNRPHGDLLFFSMSMYTTQFTGIHNVGLRLIGTLLIGTVLQVFPHRCNYSCEEVSACDGSLLSPKTPEQAVENAGAAGWMLSDDDWRRLDRLGWETSQRIIYVTW
jgi:hypothetical protein